MIISKLNSTNPRYWKTNNQANSYIIYYRLVRQASASKVAEDELLAAKLCLLEYGDIANAAGLTAANYSRVFAPVNRFGR